MEAKKIKRVRISAFSKILLWKQIKSENSCHAFDTMCIHLYYINQRSQNFQPKGLQA